MSWLELFIFVLGAAFLLILGGYWIAAALGVAGIIGMYVVGSTPAVMQVIGNIVWNTCNSFVLTSIPLFLFMGDIILVSGLSKNFYKGIVKFLHFIPGGLLHSNIVACAIFAAISGSSVATAAGIGSVAIPEMKRMNYNKSYIYGSLAAGGTLGILIPPSIPLIIYGSMTSVSVSKLFIAAMVPGIALAGLYIIYLLLNALVNPSKYAGVIHDASDQFSFGAAIKGIFPMVVLVVFIFGSIYSGIATPTEAAGVGSLFAIILGVIFGDLKIKKIWPAAENALKITSMIIYIMIGAQIISYFLTVTGTSRELVSWLVGLGLPSWVFLSCVYIIYIILGCFMDGNSMMYLTLPILYPVLLALGYNPIWFAIVLVVLIELGQITPPMGLNLFVIKGIDTESTLEEIINGCLPYMAIMMFFVLILSVYPTLATFVVE
jgi:C4-dicarboxylate transporter, DctM subunit